MNKKQLNYMGLAFVGLILVVVGCLQVDNQEMDRLASENAFEEAPVISYSSSSIPGSYIVVYKPQVLSNRGLSLKGQNYEEQQKIMKQEVQNLLSKHAIPTDRIDHVYGAAIEGFAAHLNDKELNLLRQDSDIDYIEEDQLLSVNMGGPPGGGGGGGAQEIPWGITRVGGASDGTGKRAWVIDSGIDLDHPDLNVNVGLSQSFLSGGGGSSSPDDQHGHGTHVAGTIAAIDNSEGVIGVAAGAEVVAVRVLDRRGSGSTSGVIAGVNYVAANASNNEVANMSLGGGVSTSLDNAVVSASGSCPFALAAGNESDDADNHSPARANGNNIYTISAMNSSDNWASFSNYGNPPVDYCAPGVSVKSCWKSGGYNTISGTSMASPHVAGILLMGNISTSGTVNGDPDGNADSIAHQ